MCAVGGFHTILNWHWVVGFAEVFRHLQGRAEGWDLRRMHRRMEGRMDVMHRRGGGGTSPVTPYYHPGLFQYYLRVLSRPTSNRFLPPKP